MGRVFYTDLPAHLRFTLLALADHADDEGAGVFLGKERLARKIGATVRSAYNNLRALREAGYIVHEGRLGPQGTALYRIVVARLPESDNMKPIADRQELPTGNPLHTKSSRPAVGFTVDRQPTSSKPSVTVSKKQPSGEPREVEAFVEHYHRLCPMLPRCLALTAKRRQQIAARLRERPLEEWQRILALLAASKFHTGENDRGWRADIDWLTRNAENGLKLLERGADPGKLRPVTYAAGGVRVLTYEESLARRRAEGRA